MKRDVCPQCQSPNVLVGAFVLSCCDCGWYYLHKHPCRVCGARAVGVLGCGNNVLYSCRAHPFTEDELRDVFRRFASASAAIASPTVA